MWRETIKLRLAWSLLFILWVKFSAVVNHYAVEHDLQKYSRALCASVPLLYWKIMGLYPIKNCIKSLKYYMHFTGISLIRLFCMCRCWQHNEKGSFDWLLSLNLVQEFWILIDTECAYMHQQLLYLQWNLPPGMHSWWKVIFWKNIQTNPESKWTPGVWCRLPIQPIVLLFSL